MISYVFIVIVPEWLEDFHRLHKTNHPMIQVIGGQEISFPVYILTSNEIDEDSSYVSAYGLIYQSIKGDLKMANDSQNLSLYIRTVLRKTGVKLPRYCACMNLPYSAISWCYEIFDKITFVADFHASNEELDVKFLMAAETLVKQKIKQMPKDSQDQSILIISKAVVVIAITLYEFRKWFCIERFTTNRLVKNALVNEAAQQLEMNK